MKLGMIGLGRMGGNMTERLRRAGHEVCTYDPQVESTAATLEELRDQLDPPRAFWMMVPAGQITEQTFETLLALAEPGDVIVDGGNSNFRDSQRRYGEAKVRNMGFVDAGVSGGVWGLENGYCLMVGGDDDAVQLVEPVFRDLAPEDGYAHVGGGGAGHFVKMVHNGIEYGLMQAYAEGFQIMKSSKTFPGMDMRAIAEAWRTGSVVRSWLLDLVARGLSEDPELSGIKGWVEDTGEGRWTVEAAIEESVPTPVIAESLFARFRSRMENTFGDRMLAMMRAQFGGHAVVKESPPPK
jgi:6-phosphogluconate dehydrogenase